MGTRTPFRAGAGLPPFYLAGLQATAKGENAPAKRTFCTRFHGLQTQPNKF